MPTYMWIPPKSPNVGELFPTQKVYTMRTGTTIQNICQIWHPLNHQECLEDNWFFYPKKPNSQQGRRHLHYIHQKYVCACRCATTFPATAHPLHTIWYLLGFIVEYNMGTYVTTCNVVDHPCLMSLNHCKFIRRKNYSALTRTNWKKKKNIFLVTLLEINKFGLNRQEINNCAVL